MKPSCAVTANGFKSLIDSGMKPKPWPMKKVGTSVVKGSAYTALLPVPPQSTSSDIDMARSAPAFPTN